MKKLGNRIRQILRMDEETFSIELRFEDETVGVVTLGYLFERPKGLAAEILRGGMFSMCFVENGALAWPNGFELCPDVLRAKLAHAEKKQPRRRKSARVG